MRTLHVGLRVADLDRSLAFYTNVGYEVVGEVPKTDLGHLTMLKLPGDEFVAIEIVHNPNGAAVDTETRLSHLVIQVHSMDATLTQLAAHGIVAEAATSPDGSDDFRTAWIVDPDGNPDRARTVARRSRRRDDRHRLHGVAVGHRAHLRRASQGGSSTISAHPVRPSPIVLSPHAAARRPRL